MSERFFQCGDKGLVYSSVNDIALFLWALPEHIEAYQDSMLDLAVTCSRWGDFRGMRDTLNFLVDVRIRVAQLRGESHLADRHEQPDPDEEWLNERFLHGYEPGSEAGE